MHAISLLQTWLEHNGVIGHQARVGALMRVVESFSRTVVYSSGVIRMGLGGQNS